MQASTNHQLQDLYVLSQASGLSISKEGGDLKPLRVALEAIQSPERTVFATGTGSVVANTFKAMALKQGLVSRIFSAVKNFFAGQRLQSDSSKILSHLYSVPSISNTWDRGNPYMPEVGENIDEGLSAQPVAGYLPGEKLVKDALGFCEQVTDGEYWQRHGMDGETEVGRLAVLVNSHSIDKQHVG